jgi:AcrR family transcriptional regulator
MTTLPKAEKRATGRPRCQVARKAILAATARLLEHTPLQNLAIENIAKEAGVGKATIYRWWPNKAAIVIDAFFEEVVPRTNFETGATASEVIAKQLGRMIKVLSGQQGRIVAQIIAEGQSRPDVLEHFRSVFLRDRRAAVRAVLEQGISNGEFSPALDLETAIDVVYGPVWYRLMVGHQPLDRLFAEALSKLSIAALKSL